jgi:hypothetical protein
MAPKAKRYRVEVDGLAYPAPGDVEAWANGKPRGQQVRPKKGETRTDIPPQSVGGLLRAKAIKEVK